MADFTTWIDNIQTGQAQKEVTSNAYFDAASPTTIFGRRASTTAVLTLTWGYYGGRLMVDGVTTLINDGTLTLTGSTTNYIEATRSGSVSVNTSGFTAGRRALYTVTTASSLVTDYVDYRITNDPLHGYAVVNVAGNTDVILSATAARCNIIKLSGTLTGNINVIFPNDAKNYILDNSSSGAFTITAKTVSGTGIAISQSTVRSVYSDGTNMLITTIGGSGTVTSVGISSTDLSVSGSPITSSGTITLNVNNAAITYAKIQNVTSSTLLGRYTAGAGVTQEITLGSGLSLNTSTGVLTASGSGGTVTSVGMTVPGILSVSGSPITSSGTLAVTLATQIANTVFAGATSGGATTPTFRALVAADIPRTVPVVNVYTSSSGTHTVAAGATYMTVEVQGGGSGGAGAGTGGTNGGAGGTSTFGSSFLSATGGAVTTSQVNAGAAGVGSGGDVNLAGGTGSNSGASAGTTPGVAGGNSFFGGGGGGGGGGASSAGTAAAANTGSGGGGGTVNAALNAGAGGSAGGYTSKLITSLNATYAYVVGAAGTAGAAGTGGTAGGAGAAGIIIVTTYFN